MFGFFKKTPKVNQEAIAQTDSYLFSSEQERRAICANAFFAHPRLFLDMKLCGENRRQFVENNFFNLRYMGGSEESWRENSRKYLPMIKEALQFSYDIIDKGTYEATFEEFVGQGEPNAWNLVRMAGVTQNAYTAGYVELEAAKANIQTIGAKLAENYHSWEQVATDFLLGKLEFNHLKELQGADTEVFTSVADIMVMIDLMFNDKDTPLQHCLFDSQEKLSEAANHMFEGLVTGPQRARGIMAVYQDVYGWAPFVLVESANLEARERDTLEYVTGQLSLSQGEEVIYVHAFPSKNPEKSEIDLILTNKSLVTVFNKKAKKNGEYVVTSLDSLQSGEVAMEEVEFANQLSVKGQPMVENVSLNSERDIPAYLEILRDMIDYCKMLNRVN